MAVSLTHEFESSKPASTDNTLIDGPKWNAEHALTLTALSVLGRSSATGGAVEEITAGSNGYVLLRASNALAFSQLGASLVSFTPTGGIAATNVQTAVAELDSEKLNLTGGILTGLLTVEPGITTKPDQDVWDAAGAARFGSDLPEDGTAAEGSANENVINVQAFIAPTSSAASYQKSAGIYFAFTQDPSTALILRDAVGLDRRGIIAATNTAGRAWGGTDWAQIQAGGVGDGLLIGNEIDIDNNGTNQSSVDTATSKYGLMVASIGAQPVTAGVFFDHLTDGFHYCVYANQDDIESGGHFLTLNGLFNVDRSGNIMGAAGMRVGFAGTPTAADRVEIGDANFYADFGAGAPQITFDANDAISYNRTDNQWVFATGGDAGPIIRNNVIFPAANDAVALGVSGAAFSDLFLASGAVINFNEADVTITHGSNVLTIAGGNLNLASGQVLQVNSTQVVSAQQAAIANLVWTYSANDPGTTPNSAVTFADGTALVAATAYEAFDEIEGKINAILAALRTHGLIAT